MLPVQPPDSSGQSAAGGIRLTLPASLAAGQSQGGQIITPAGSGAAGSGGITPGAVVGSTASASSSSILSINSSSTSMTMMSQQVGEFLGGVDSSLAQNEYLKLLLAAIIMSVLLGESDSQNSDNAMKLLEQLSGSQQSAMYISIQSTSQSLSIQETSQSVMSSDATTAMGVSATDGECGQNLDLSI